jgi:adenylylsulfate kinase|tara:strand:+ start:124 stop:531 length:408 start_codon:yes stop_codon:yes gene_type:complete
MKVLIFGLPGSGKSTLAEELSKLTKGIWLNADKIREEYNDWDFSMKGRIRQANRMRYLSDGVVKAKKIAIADFVCPTERARNDFDADFSIWMDTIKEGRFEDTNIIFEIPTNYNYKVTEWTENNPYKILTEINNV